MSLVTVLDYTIYAFVIKEKIDSVNEHLIKEN